MLKQVVCEVVVGGDVVLLINGVEAKKYCKNPALYQNYEDKDLNGKKEFQEVRIGNVTKYWIGVSDAVALNVTKEYIDKRKLRYKEKMELKRKLIIAKKIRMMRYAGLIAEGKEIIVSEKESNDALALKKMENRVHKNLLNLLSHVGAASTNVFMKF